MTEDLLLLLPPRLPPEEWPEYPDLEPGGLEDEEPLEEEVLDVLVPLEDVVLDEVPLEAPLLEDMPDEPLLEEAPDDTLLDEAPDGVREVPLEEPVLAPDALEPVCLVP